MKKPEITNGQAETRKMTRDQLEKEIKKMRDRDREMVTGIFKNLENPAQNGSKGSVSFGYKAYPGDELEFYELWDGERYNLPRGVARHLNQNCWYKEYKHLSGEMGQQGIRGANADGRLASKDAGMQMARKVHRYAFHSLEFMDEDPMESSQKSIIEVTKL